MQSPRAADGGNAPPLGALGRERLAPQLDASFRADAACAALGVPATKPIGPYGPQESYASEVQHVVELTSKDSEVLGTVCKIRGPMTNQPEKIGSDEFKKIDWILTDSLATGYSRYTPLTIKVGAAAENGCIVSEIKNLKQLLPNFGEDPLDKTKSTSDHVPICVPVNKGFCKVFQMNLLANGLAGDGFLSVPSSTPDGDVVDLRAKMNLLR